MFFARAEFSRIAPLALLLGSIALPGSAQTTVFAQPAVFPGSANFSSWTSSSATAFVTSDNFTLHTAASLTGITWQGFTFSGNGGGPGVEPTTFDIEFRADNSGIPGTVLDTELVAPNKTVAGTSDFFGGGQINIYDYSAALSGLYTASANTPLWVTVIGNTPLPNFWTWTQGTGGDGSSYQEVTGDPNLYGTSGSRTGDRAFSLSSSPVPEASTTISFGLLLLLGMGGLVVAAKRKKATG